MMNLTSPRRSRGLRPRRACRRGDLCKPPAAPARRPASDGFDLQPVWRAAAGPIDAVESLGDDAFEAFTLGRVEHGDAFAEMRGSDLPARTGNGQGFEHVAPLGIRLIEQ